MRVMINKGIISILVFYIGWNLVPDTALLASALFILMIITIHRMLWTSISFAFPGKTKKSFYIASKITMNTAFISVPTMFLWMVMTWFLSSVSHDVSVIFGIVSMVIEVIFRVLITVVETSKNIDDFMRTIEPIMTYGSAPKAATGGK